MKTVTSLLLIVLVVIGFVVACVNLWQATVGLNLPWSAIMGVGALVSVTYLAYQLWYWSARLL